MVPWFCTSPHGTHRPACYFSYFRAKDFPRFWKLVPQQHSVHDELLGDVVYKVRPPNVTSCFMSHLTMVAITSTWPMLPYLAYLKTNLANSGAPTLYVGSTASTFLDLVRYGVITQWLVISGVKSLLWKKLTFEAVCWPQLNLGLEPLKPHDWRLRGTWYIRPATATDSYTTHFQHLSCSKISLEMAENPIKTITCLPLSALETNTPWFQPWCAAMPPHHRSPGHVGHWAQEAPFGECYLWLSTRWTPLGITRFIRPFNQGSTMINTCE